MLNQFKAVIGKHGLIILISREIFWIFFLDTVFQRRHTAELDYGLFLKMLVTRWSGWGNYSAQSIVNVFSNVGPCKALKPHATFKQIKLKLQTCPVVSFFFVKYVVKSANQHLESSPFVLPCSRSMWSAVSTHVCTISKQM